jgi:hypothetical protein
MAKAKTTSSTTKQNPDAELLAKIREHDVLWSEWGRQLLLDEDDTRIDELSDQCIDLEFQITVTPAHTARGLASKRRVIRNAAFKDNHGFFDWVIAHDADRIRRAKTGKQAEHTAAR